MKLSSIITDPGVVIPAAITALVLVLALFVVGLCLSY